jgi:hypothetical protein
MLCIICKSTYCTDIEKAIRKHTPRIEIYKQYAKLINYTGSELSFYVTMNRHWHHKKENTITTGDNKTGISIQELVTKVRNIYGDKLNTMTPEELMREIKLKDVFAGEKVLIEAKKVKMQEEAMELMMAKLFGPVLEGVTIEEGEISGPDTIKQITGLQQTNP